MRNVIAVIVGALIYYLSYHGSVGVLYDMIGLFYGDQESQKEFVRSAVFDDIAAFSSFIIPAVISATFLGLSVKERPSSFGVIVCGVYSVILWSTLAYHFGSAGGIRLSDLVAPLSALPVAWFIYRLAKRHA